MISKTPRWQCPEPLWEILKGLIIVKKPSRLGGRPPSELRKVVDGIFYVIRTGIAWKDMPPCFASSSTCHRYFQRWQREKIFQFSWEQCLALYDDEWGIDVNHLSSTSSQNSSIVLFS